MPDSAPNNCPSGTGHGCTTDGGEQRQRHDIKTPLADKNIASSAIAVDVDTLFLRREAQAIDNLCDAVKKHLSGRDQIFVLDALAQLEDIYRPQASSRIIRKDDWPAVTHPVIAATTAITNYKITDPEIIVGILYHDEVELNHIELEDLSTYGTGVESLVENLTNPKFTSLAANLKVRGDPRPMEDIARVLYHDHVSEKIKDPRTFVAKLSDLEELTSTIFRVNDELFQRRCLQKWVPVVNDMLSELKRTPPDCAKLLSPEVRAEAVIRLQDRLERINEFLGGN